MQKVYIDKEKAAAAAGAGPVLDFEEDGTIFMLLSCRNTGIDLSDVQGKLPWRKFLYLFNGLSADTKIKQVMRIREMEVPPFNGKNARRFRRSMS